MLSSLRRIPAQSVVVGVRMRQHNITLRSLDLGWSLCQRPPCARPQATLSKIERSQRYVNQGEEITADSSGGRHDSREEEEIALVVVCIYYCSTYHKAVRLGGEG